MILRGFAARGCAQHDGSIRRAGHADGDGRVPGGELGEFVSGAGEADVEPVDFAEPAFGMGLGDAVEEVVADLIQSGSLAASGRRGGQRMPR